MKIPNHVTITLRGEIERLESRRKQHRDACAAYESELQQADKQLMKLKAEQEEIMNRKRNAQRVIEDTNHAIREIHAFINAVQRDDEVPF